ncbi:MAG: hypothetical protein QY304_01690 [Candidatus Paceibacterota bacterium]|nr:MAG: hypothetical protein QY304_01690 [Candidatus Paceibacterota bacterium]
MNITLAVLGVLFFISMLIVGMERFVNWKHPGKQGDRSKGKGRKRKSDPKRLNRKVLIGKIAVYIVFFGPALFVSMAIFFQLFHERPDRETAFSVWAVVGLAVLFTLIIFVAVLITQRQGKSAIKWAMIATMIALPIYLVWYFLDIHTTTWIVMLYVVKIQVATEELESEHRKVLWWITTTIIALVVFFAFWWLSKLFKKKVRSEDGTRRAGVFENTCRRVLKYDVGSTTLFRFFATGLVTLVIMIGVHFLAQIYWPDSWSGWRRSGVELFWIPNLAILLFFPLIITFRRWGWLPALAIVGITVLGVLSSLDWLSSTTSTDNGRHRSTATQPSQPQEWLSVGELRGKQSVTTLRNLYYDEYQLSYDIWYPDSRGKRGEAKLKRCIEDGKYYGTFEYRNPRGEGDVWLEEIPDRPGHFRGQSWSDYTNGERVWFEIRPK